MTVNYVQMAAKLYECRDTAKRLLGDKYPDTIRRWGEIVERRAKQEEGDILATSIHMAKMVGGADAVMLLAAAVELVEPSNAADKGRA
jgi:hypothetical protein